MLHVFKCEYKRKGTLTPEPIYHLGKNERHAVTLIRAKLNADIGKDYELSEAVLVSDMELPEDDGLFRELQRQREILEPSPPAEPEATPFYQFWIDRGAARPTKLLIYSRKGPDAAKAKAIDRMEAMQSDTPLTLLPQRKSMDINAAKDSAPLGSDVLSILTRPDLEEFAHDMEADHKRDTLAAIANMKLQVDKAETVPSSLDKLPAPSRLLIEARRIVAQMAIGESDDVVDDPEKAKPAIPGIVASAGM